MWSDEMTGTKAQPPMSPDQPEPTRREDRAPEIEVDRPDDRDLPDAAGVSSDAGTVEAPD
jgi:hypothetical protein